VVSSIQSAVEKEPEQIKPPRPFLKWAGGKTRLLAELLERVPAQFNRYHEPMLGGGALFFALSSRIELAFLCDVSEELVNCFTVVRNKLPELTSDLERHVYEQEYYYNIRNVDRDATLASWSDVQRASRLIYLNKTCFNGLYRVNSRGEFNVPFGKYSNPKILDAENLENCSAVLNKAEVKCCSFEQVSKKAEKGDFVYFDPPYDPLSDTAHFTAYSKTGFDNAMQLKLRDICQQLDRKGVRFMLSNSYTTLSLDLYKEFRLETVEAPRAINSKASKRGKIKEILVRNY